MTRKLIVQSKERDKSDENGADGGDERRRSVANATGRVRISIARNKDRRIDLNVQQKKNN